MPDLSVDDAIVFVIDNQVPILFCDTCALLDLIRLPYRYDSHTQAATILRSAQSIYIATTNNIMHLILPPLVENEWNKHSNSILLESKKHFETLNHQIQVANTLTEVFGKSVDYIDYASFQLPESLYNLSENLLNISTKLVERDDIVYKASTRTITDTAPARKGKGHKDCIIYEHSLHIMQEIRSHNITQPLIFMTSNTKDFCDISGNLKDPIASELSSLSAVLTTEWNWALHELGISS